MITCLVVSADLRERESFW